MILLSGFLTGLLLSAPIGPANILCLQRTISSGRMAALIVGLGAAVGDIIFVILSLFGLLALSDLDGSVTNILRYVGGSVLVIMGLVGIIRAKSQTHLMSAANNNTQRQKRYFLKDFFTSFMMTVTNPLTPVGVLTAVAAMGLGGGLLADAQTMSAILFGLAIFIGSLSWWLFLSFLGSYLFSKLSSNFLNIMNISASILLVVIGLYIIIFGTNHVALQ